jgi:CO dehydrogenase maturation factor
MRDVTTQSGTVVIDLEAGLEHLSRGTPRYVDMLLLVAEPYFKSMETAARSKSMADQLGISRVLAIANKVRGRQDEEAMRSFLARAGLPVLGVIAADEVILEADRMGRSPLDHDGASPAVVAITKLADALTIY